MDGWMGNFGVGASSWTPLVESATTQAQLLRYTGSALNPPPKKSFKYEVLGCSATLTFEDSEKLNYTSIVLLYYHSILLLLLLLNAYHALIRQAILTHPAASPLPQDLPVGSHLSSRRPSQSNPDSTITASFNSAVKINNVRVQSHLPFRSSLQRYVDVHIHTLHSALRGTSSPTPPCLQVLLPNCMALGEPACTCIESRTQPPSAGNGKSKK